MLFFFNDTATTEIYTLSLHDALPISAAKSRSPRRGDRAARRTVAGAGEERRAPRAARGGRRGAEGVLPGSANPQRIGRDRKSTRLNSSHANISYAVFCLKKKKSARFT